MLLKLIILFILFPLAELALLIYLGTVIGTLNTIIIVVVTGLFGAILARRQGLTALYNIKANLNSGYFPGEQILHGALIFTGGLLFVAPGLVADVVGVGLLVPAVRRMVIRWLRKLLEEKVKSGDVRYYRLR